ncbi:lipocalin family protein, partial [Candidatus Altiarchaeota archaeon]
TNPRSGCTWTSGWEVYIPDEEISLTITPTMQDQEVYDWLWEGSCTVEGTVKGRTVKGWAYYEEHRDCHGNIPS